MATIPMFAWAHSYNPSSHDLEQPGVTTGSDNKRYVQTGTYFPETPWLKALITRSLFPLVVAPSPFVPACAGSQA